MEKVKATLRRKVGPFTVGAWLIIVIAGVGIGLLVRKRLGKSDGDDMSGQAQVGFADAGLPTGIRDNVVVTGRAPTTVYQQPTTRLVEDPEEEPPGSGGTPPRQAPKRKRTGTTRPKAQPEPKPKRKRIESRPPPKTAQPKAQTYTVQWGDSLWKIAGKFGFAHWRPIYDANRQTIGPNPDLIRPGQKLVIPAK